MYDEFERAVTGRSRRRFPRLGWLAVGLGTVLALGVGGLMWAYHAVRDQLREFSVVRVSEALTATLAATLDGLEPVADADPSIRREIMDHFQAAGLDQEAVRDMIEGSLLLRSPEGEFRVDVSRSDHGGEFVMVGEGKALHLGAGESARDVPDWVPSVDGMPETPRKRLSASAGKGEFGIVTWEPSGEPDDVVDAYRARLDEEGYEVRVEHSMRGERGASASVFGTNESSGRMVFLAMSREEHAIRAVLGYGAEDRP